MAIRSKRPKGKSKFTVKKVRLTTVFGASLGVISVVSVLLLLYLTFLKDGQATLSYGLAGALTSVFSVTGLIISILCINDHYQPHRLGWVGLFTNGAAALAMVGILYLGML